MRRSRWREALIGGLALALLVPGASPAQEPEGPVTPDSAQKIRDDLRRPPSNPPFDAVDALTVPIRIATFPLQVIGTGLAELGAPVADLKPAVTTALERLAEVGLRPSVGAIGPRSGIAAQMRFTKLEPIFVETAFSVRESQRHRLGLRLAGQPGHLDGRYTFQRNAAVQFWGIGPDSREEDESDFLWDISEFSGDGSLRIPPVTLRVGAAFEDNRVGRGFDDGTPDVEETFEAATLFGVRERTNYVRFELGTALDLTRLAGLQLRGFYLELGSVLYRGVDGTESDFHRFTGAAHGYIPLNRRQSFALRGIAEINRGDDGPGVPFTHLASLGDSRGARAFSSDRFRDLDMAAIMAEWRYEIWLELHERARIEGFVFVDEGGVSPRLSDLDGSDLRESYGFGLRGISGGHLLALAYLAFGEEGARLQAAFSWAY